MKFARALLLLAVLFLFVSPVYALGNHQVTVPEDLRALLVLAFTGFVSYFITQGLKSLSAQLAQVSWLSWVDISGWGSVITAFIVTGAMFYFDMGLGYVPAALAPFAPLAVQFLIAVLTAIGTHSTIKAFGAGRVVPAQPLSVKGFQPK